MSDQLFPVIDVSEIYDDNEIEDIDYKRSYRWDMEKGDFVRDGANKIAVCDGKVAYMQWCYKMLFTEQKANLAYEYDFGVELDKAMGETSIGLVQAITEETISEALLANPLTEYVRDFEFDWESDNLYCTFTVKGKDMDAFQIQLSVDEEEVNN